MSEQALTSASILGSLSGSALLGLMVIALAFVVIHLYKQQSGIVGEKQDKQLRSLDEIKTKLNESNMLTKANLDAYKENAKQVNDFLREHCKKNIEELEKVSEKADEIKEGVNALSGVGAWFKDLNNIKKG